MFVHIKLMMEGDGSGKVATHEKINHLLRYSTKIASKKHSCNVGPHSSGLKVMRAGLIG